MASKKWYKSRTIKFSIILAGFGIAVLTLPEFNMIVMGVPAAYQGPLFIAVAGVVAALRAITTQPINK